VAFLVVHQHAPGARPIGNETELAVAVGESVLILDGRALRSEDPHLDEGDRLTAAVAGADHDRRRRECSGGFEPMGETGESHHQREQEGEDERVCHGWAKFRITKLTNVRN